jgi:nicotinamidase-related amidase
MSAKFTLSRKQTALLIVDVQEKLFPLVDRPCEVMENLQKVISGFKILNLPIFVTEQYPKGLGKTIDGLKAYLPENQLYIEKTTFSCVADPQFKSMIQSLPIQQWVVAGIEAHVCVLQTAKGLLDMNKDVAILNDAITSRSIFDFSTAIAELRDYGARITSTETVLFELVGDSKAAEFKQLSQLIK